MNTKKNAREIITEKFIDALNQEVIPWHRPWSIINPQSIHGHHYTGVNKLLLSLFPQPDPRYITFNKCREMGGNVKKGEKGHLVVFYNATERENDEGKKETKRFLRYYYVWSVSQCENLEVKPLAIKTYEHTPDERAEAIVEKYVASGVKIVYGGNRACYSQLLDTIYMPNKEWFETPAHYYSTLFHEIIHSTGRFTRLNRVEATTDTAKEKYSREELVAEIGASFLLAEAGIDSPTIDDNAKAYIQSWASALENDANMIIWASARANQALACVIGKEETEEEQVTSDPELVAA